MMMVLVHQRIEESWETGRNRLSYDEIVLQCLVTMVAE